MMPLEYLLDTNVLSEPMRPRPDPKVLERILSVGNTASTASIVWHEIDFGRRLLPRGRRRERIDELIRELEGALSILPYDLEAARWHARERARLSKRGKAPSFVDGQIAAIAAVHNLVLVTRNVSDFRAFSGLSVKNWFSSHV